MAVAAAVGATTVAAGDDAAAVRVVVAGRGVPGYCSSTHAPGSVGSFS